MSRTAFYLMSSASSAIGGTAIIFAAFWYLNRGHTANAIADAVLGSIGIGFSVYSFYSFYAAKLERIMSKSKKASHR